MASEQEYEGKVEEPMNETTTLYRPVGQEELNLIQSSGYREFPPRLPHQPIFYPVLYRSLYPRRIYGDVY